MHIRIILEFFEKKKQMPRYCFFSPKFQLCFWWTAMIKNKRNNWTMWWSFTFIYFVSLFLFHNQCSPPYVFHFLHLFYFYFYFFNVLSQVFGLPWWLSGKESTCQCRRCKRHGFNPWVQKIPWSWKWQLTPIFLPEKFHRQRSLAG